MCIDAEKTLCMGGKRRTDGEIRKVVRALIDAERSRIPEERGENERCYIEKQTSVDDAENMITDQKQEQSKFMIWTGCSNQMESRNIIETTCFICMSGRAGG